MERKRVLLVEPDEATCRAIRAMLVELDYDVVTMSDGESAISVYNYVEANLVLTHYPVGKRSTENLVSYIRKHSSAPTTPIIAMLAHPDRKGAREALSQGCDDVMVKPISSDVLGPKLRNLVGGTHDDPWPLGHS